jgi:hypothetical protein
MEKVTGIGGFFFRAKDPKALALWYQQHLGILTVPTKDGETSWQQEARSTAFAPFKGDERLFRRSAEGLDAECSSARSRQNGGPATSCGNRGES